MEYCDLFNIQYVDKIKPELLVLSYTLYCYKRLQGSTITYKIEFHSYFYILHKTFLNPLKSQL